MRAMVGADMDMMTMGTEEVTDTIIDTDIIKKPLRERAVFISLIVMITYSR